MGLKADYSPWRALPRALKPYIPRDLDGAYRVSGRLDEMAPEEVSAAAHRAREEANA